MSLSISNVELYSTQASMLADHQMFIDFYDAYAPKVWGIILEANLSLVQSETILINTFTQAWRQLDSPILDQQYLLIKLLKIACEEGLPTKVLQTILSK